MSKKLAAIGSNGAKLIAVLTIVACFLWAVGAHVPAIPWLGSQGAKWFANFSVHMALAPLFAIAILLGLCARGEKWLGVIIAMGLLASGLAGYAIVKLVSLGHALGAQVSLLETVLPELRTVTGPGDQQFVITDDNDEQVTLLLDLPEAEGAPVLTFVHGGGWIGGSPDLRALDRQWFAEQGFLVVSIGYRRSSRQNHQWDRAIGQVGCGLAWIQAHADKFGGDPQRLVILGDSAGGNLVLNAAARQAAGTMPQLHAVAAMYPVLDPVAFYDNDAYPEGQRARLMGEVYTGGSPREFPERYAAITPINHLTADAPPMLVLTGENDALTKPGLALQFDEEARAIGADIETVLLPYSAHGFDNLNTIARQIKRQKLRDFFLQALGG